MADEIAPDDISKRRLPQWMMGTASAASSKPIKKTRKPETKATEHTANHTDEDDGVDVGKQRRRRAKPKSRAIIEESESSESSARFLVQCEEKTTARRRRREVGVPDDDSDGNHDLEKRRKRGGGATRSRKTKISQKKSLGSECGADDSIQNDGVVGDEDEDLTMDDLISIAEEYAKGEESKEVIRDELDNVGNGIRVTEEERGSCTENTATLNLSGNPTQDMLDLFLGPLLKKTDGEKKPADLISKDIVDFGCYEFKTHNKDTQGGSSEQPPVLTKKKSSLKDKVALFLD